MNQATARGEEQETAIVIDATHTSEIVTTATEEKVLVEMLIRLRNKSVCSDSPKRAYSQLRNLLLNKTRAKMSKA